MAVSKVVIDAYKRRYSRSQLEEALDVALSDRASGVQITQVNFQDGGGSGQVIKGDPNELLEILELALQSLDTDIGSSGMTSSVNFSTRRTET